ncbi:hypothetical protein BH23ACT5_BH23ACT5_19100 [soil metagenome]
MRLFTAILVLVTACAGQGGVAPTSTPPSAPAPSTTATPSTSSSAPQSIGSPTVAAVVTDCTAPPVTFSLLCQVYQLIETNHVDAPFDPSALAAGAAIGAASYTPAPQGAPPVDFRCAVPHRAFESTCSVIAEQLARGSYPIEEAVERAVTSMITLSLDPFTYYIPPALAGRVTESGVVTAVGLLVSITDAVGSRCSQVEAGCRLEVVFSVGDGPAARAGLEAGDVITAIDGDSVDGLNLVEVASLLDGEAGTTVEVAVEEVDGQERTISITRSEAQYPPLAYDTPRPGVGYLRIPDFEFDVPAFVHAALESLTETGMDRLVIDLRDNPGGYVDVATLVTSEFLDGGLVFRSLGPEENLDYPVQPGGLATSAPAITVVVNGGSASAAEILATVLSERSRATIVGSPTFGKDTVQIGFPLRNAGELRVTIARWVTPEGGSVGIGGLVPDDLIDIPPDASAEEVIDLVLG